MAALVACLLLVGCGNFGNVYLPPVERKPLTGPEPKEFPAALTTPKPVAAREKIRLNVPAGAPLTLKGTWSAAQPATVVWRVNARKIAEVTCGPGDCEVAQPVPSGTILPDVATLIEIETNAPIVLKGVAFDR